MLTKGLIIINCAVLPAIFVKAFRVIFIAVLGFYGQFGLAVGPGGDEQGARTSQELHCTRLLSLTLLYKRESISESKLGSGE